MTVAGAIGITLASQGCALEHQASARFVDPALKEATRPMVADRAKHRVVLDAGTFGDVEVTRLRGPGRFDLGSGARSGTAHRYALKLRVTVPNGLDWKVDCEGRRGRPAAADYAAALDENHDEIAMRCEIRPDGGAADEVWTVETGGTLRNNVIGKVSTPSRKGAYEVEILTRYKLFSLVRRDTPVALGQVRTGAGAVAAMTLARPEHVWIADRQHADIGLWLAILGAHRFMPLGWND